MADQLQPHEASKDDSQPAGGYDAAPIVRRPPGYTVKITFHKATQLPLADFGTFSSDPYLKAELRTALPSRHKEDSPIAFRTRTVWHNTEPEWEQTWILHHIPHSGFRLKARLYDEDSSDRDDRLGNAHITVGPVDEHWEGIRNKAFRIQKRSGSWRAYALRAVASAMNKEKRLGGLLYVSVEVLGISPGDNGGRAYTVGLNYWCKNYSPLLGRIAGSKEPNNAAYHEKHDADHENATGELTISNSRPDAAQKSNVPNTPNKKNGAQRYNFQSNQMQLQGPVPAELYHRYVEFRPFVKAMYTQSGLRGILLSKALHHQHANIYNFNRETRYGVFDQPCRDMTCKFLDLAHWDEGGRLHTYVITLDGHLRFTETGKEFGIDLLSKHTMHSDVSVYIAYSGEFFVRRATKHESPEHTTAIAAQLQPSSDRGEARDPADYELIIDNDSGTYRPNGDLLPVLREFLQRNFPGLRIVTLDCQADEELMKRLKNEQRERKKATQGRMVFTELSRTSSLSSGDNERLEEMAARQEAEATGQPRHKFGEAIGPFIRDHEHVRHLL